MEAAPVNSESRESVKARHGRCSGERYPRNSLHHGQSFRLLWRGLAKQSQYRKYQQARSVSLPRAFAVLASR